VNDGVVRESVEYWVGDHVLGGLWAKVMISGAILA